MCVRVWVGVVVWLRVLCVCRCLFIDCVCRVCVCLCVFVCVLVCVSVCVGLFE